MAKNKAAY